MLLYCCVNLKISLKKWTSVLFLKKKLVGHFLNYSYTLSKQLAFLQLQLSEIICTLKTVFILSEVMREVGIHESWENMY